MAKRKLQQCQHTSLEMVHQQIGSNGLLWRTWVRCEDCKEQLNIDRITEAYYNQDGFQITAPYVKTPRDPELIFEKLKYENPDLNHGTLATERYPESPEKTTPDA